MKTIGMSSRKFLISLGVLFALLSSAVMPVVASAAEVSANASTQTVQLLPPGTGNTCPQFATPIFKAYVYDNQVNSFDVTLADASYVAIAGSVGNTQVPFNYMTRFVDASGVLHMHVDTPAVSVYGTVPVTLTLLSVRPDKTVCAATVSATLIGGASPVSSGGSGGNKAYVPPVKKVVPDAGTSVNNTSSGTDGSVSSPTAGGTFVANAGIQNTLTKVCATTGGATRLWTVLLAIYLLMVAATILAQPTGKPADRSSLFLGAAIVIPLLVLFGVWEATTSCRIGMWAPIAAIAIAAVGFALGFRNHSQFSKTFTPAQAPKSPSVPTPSTKPMITPPPKPPTSPAPKPPTPPAPKNENNKK